MSDEIRPSKPSDFTPEEAIVSLGRNNASGQPLYWRIRAVPKSKISALFKGLPSAPGAKSDAEKEAEAALADEVKAAREKETLERWQALMRFGCVEPRLLFAGDADDPDGIRWDDLDNLLQENLQNAILAHSGFKLPQEADALLSFRVVERGGIPIR